MTEELTWLPMPNGVSAADAWAHDPSVHGYTRPLVYANKGFWFSESYQDEDAYPSEQLPRAVRIGEQIYYGPADQPPPPKECPVTEETKLKCDFQIDSAKGLQARVFVEMRRAFYELATTELTKGWCALEVESYHEDFVFAFMRALESAGYKVVHHTDTGLLEIIWV